MNGLELRHLRTLQALRDTGKVAAAAERVYLTQSAVSHQLKDLEERCGCKLIYRQSQPYRFTAAGNRLLELADKVIPMVQDAKNDLLRIAGGDSGRLHISIECHSCVDWLLAAVDAYQKEWPDIELDISTGFTLKPMPALIRGELDMVITSDVENDSRLRYTPLFQYQAQLAVAPHHKLAEEKFILPEHLKTETLITYPIERTRLDIFRYFLDPAGVEPAKIRTAELTSLMIHMVATGRCVVSLPNWALHNYVEKQFVKPKPLGKNGLWSTLYAATRDDNHDYHYIQQFCDTVRENCQKTLVGVKPVEKAKELKAAG